MCVLRPADQELSRNGDRCPPSLCCPQRRGEGPRMLGVGIRCDTRSPKQTSLLEIPFLYGRNLGQVLWVSRLVTTPDFLIQTWPFSPGGSITHLAIYLISSKGVRCLGFGMKGQERGVLSGPTQPTCPRGPMLSNVFQFLWRPNHSAKICYCSGEKREGPWCED